MDLWEYMDRIWTYHNNTYHENNTKQVARYKIEELDRKMQPLWDKNTEPADKLHEFQAMHFIETQQIEYLRYV
jgi:hypothetical protein